MHPGGLLGLPSHRPVAGSQDTDVVAIEDGSGYIPAAVFRLPDFYDRYSPHAYIDYSRVYVRHPKPKREYTLPKGYLELLEQKRYSPSTVKTYRAYFSDFMEYHKGRNIDRLKVADINRYILYLVNEKKISVSQQNMRINAIKFYYEQVKGGKRQYYGGITRAKEYKSLPEVLSRNEVRRILSCLANRKHRCMISLIYSAGLRRSELLNLTPQDIMSERMLIRIMGKGKNAATRCCRRRYCANFGNISRNIARKNGCSRAKHPESNIRQVHW